MKRQIAFLRGINISGKNKVPMAELKLGCEELGFTFDGTHRCPCGVKTVVAV